MDQEQHILEYGRCKRANGLWAASSWCAAFIAVAGVYIVAIQCARWEKNHAPPLPAPTIYLDRNMFPDSGF